MIKFTKPEDVFGHLLAEKYFAAYHWMNRGQFLRPVSGRAGENDPRWVVFENSSNLT